VGVSPDDLLRFELTSPYPPFNKAILASLVTSRIGGNPPTPLKRGTLKPPFLRGIEGDLNLEIKFN
jgi:hypothetical protein